MGFTASWCFCPFNTKHCYGWWKHGWFVSDKWQNSSRTPNTILGNTVALSQTQVLANVFIWTNNKFLILLIFCSVIFLFLAPKSPVWVLVFRCLCVCLCIYAWLPCGDSVQADLFICSLICQTRSNTSVPLYQNFFSFIQTEISAQTDTQVHTRSLLSTDHLQSCQCPPAGQSPARPPYKINEFHGTAAATSNNHALGLYSPKQINLNHLFEKHAQHDTEIHANLWQTISKFPFQI